MGIRRTTGKITSLGKLAKLAGQAEAAQREQQYKEAAYARAQEMAHRERLTMFQAQLRENTEYKRMEFEANKILASDQHDFMMEEVRRQALYDRDLQQDIKKMNERDMALDLILNDDTIDRKQKEAMVREVKLKYYNYQDVVKGQGENLDIQYKIQRLSQAAQEGPLRIAQMEKNLAKADPFDEMIAGMRGNTSPPADYPDAFQEDGQWKVIRNGKKYIVKEE